MADAGRLQRRGVLMETGVPPIAPCRRPGLPPAECRRCWREPEASEGEGIEPSISRAGECMQFVERGDATFGIPW
jgi:hypothetical protein